MGAAAAVNARNAAHTHAYASTVSATLLTVQRACAHTLPLYCEILIHLSRSVTVGLSSKVLQASDSDAVLRKPKSQPCDQFDIVFNSNTFTNNYQPLAAR